MIRQIQKTTIINIRETSLINLVLMQDLADYLGKRDELKIGEKGIRCIYHLCLKHRKEDGRKHTI